MNRPLSSGFGLIGLTLILAGCDYSAPTPSSLPSEIVDGSLPAAPVGGGTVFENPDREAPPEGLDPELVRRRGVILDNFIKLMRTAARNPGGQNFAIATENLNELFEGTNPNDYVLNEESKRFLLRKLALLFNSDPEPIVKSLSSPRFADRDARHIEDCMLYHNVATRVAGEGDDLTRVRRIFDWICRNVELIPQGALAGNGLAQAQVRPADVLVRGMATEFGGWSERGWLFMVLCRQINVDVGLLTLTPRPPQPPEVAPESPGAIPWITTAVVDGKLYLFDQRLGVEISGPDGTGVATLEDALKYPIVLERLDIPGVSRYGTTSRDIAESAVTGVLVDSSAGYFSTKMKLLQGQLRGEYRTILYRDLWDQAKNLGQALTRALGKDSHIQVNLWDLPARVEQGLFTDQNFVRSTQMALQYFKGELPLLYARSEHLRGDLTEAINKYVELRLRTDGVMRTPTKDPIPPEIQRALDVYSTLFLAQCHMDRGDIEQAEGLFQQMLKMTPEPGPGRHYYYMLRWNALTNLGRICEKKGDRAGAIRYYTEVMHPGDRHGNLLRARDLVWSDPFLPPAPPLAPAPPVPVDTPVPAPEKKATGENKPGAISPAGQ